ncbi:MAG: ABC transporter permease [Nanobdellota archaeon]
MMFEKIISNKYIQQFLLELKAILEYKLDMYAKIVKPMIKFGILAAIWTAIFTASNQEMIAEYSRLEFITYIAIVTIISNSLLSWKTGGIVTDDIRLGNLSSLITKPISYFKRTFAKIFARTTITGIYSILLFFIILIVLKSGFGIELIQPTAIQIGFFIASTIISLILAFCYYFIISCTAFWWGETWSIMGVAIMFQAFLSGEIIPLHISDLLMKIASFFPFKSIIYTPTSIIMGEKTIIEIITSVGIQMAWIVVLVIIAKAVLKKGLRRFEAQGG